MSMIERVARVFAASHGADPDEIVSHKRPYWMGEDVLQALGSDQDADEYYALIDGGIGDPEWCSAIKRWRWWVPDARAAIEAMREPTDAMRESGGAAFAIGDLRLPDEGWEAMDVALAEKSP